MSKTSEELEKEIKKLRRKKSLSSTSAKAEVAEKNKLLDGLRALKSDVKDGFANNPDDSEREKLIQRSKDINVSMKKIQGEISKLESASENYDKKIQKLTQKIREVEIAEIWVRTERELNNKLESNDTVDEKLSYLEDFYSEAVNDKKRKHVFDNIPFYSSLSFSHYLLDILENDFDQDQISNMEQTVSAKISGFMGTYADEEDYYNIEPGVYFFALRSIVEFARTSK